ncbi:MAG: IS21-like element helper ATPase IstB, partial [Clostridiales Family XIII bacterium]|nr:IS21-like element helper ATPase IstB [Clostridiales Family XIII bacterium]
MDKSFKLSNPPIPDSPDFPDKPAKPAGCLSNLAVVKEVQDLAKSLYLEAFAEFEQYYVEGEPLEITLLKILKAQVQIRYDKLCATRIKNAGFPMLKTVHEFDFSPKIYPNVKEGQFSWLLSCEYIKDRQGAVLVGSSGLGKTHLAIAVGIEAINKGYRVLFRRADTLLTEMLEAKNNKILLDLSKKIENADLLILDELGIQSYSKEESGLLYRTINERYEKKSVILTTNLHFSEWGSFIPDEKISKATIDRIINHSRIINMNGSKSYRFTHTLDKK